MDSFELYFALLLMLFQEGEAVHALTPGSSTPVQPVVVGKYAIQGPTGGPLQVSRTAGSTQAPPVWEFVLSTVTALSQEAAAIKTEPVGGTVEVQPINLGTNYVLEAAGGGPFVVARLG